MCALCVMCYSSCSSTRKSSQRCSGGSQPKAREHADYKSDANNIQAAHWAHRAQNNASGPEWPLSPGSCWQCALLLLSMHFLIDQCILNLIEQPPAACVCPGWHSTYATFKPSVCQLCNHLLLKRHPQSLQTICCSLALVTCPAESCKWDLTRHRLASAGGVEAEEYSITEDLEKVDL